MTIDEEISVHLTGLELECMEARKAMRMRMRMLWELGEAMKDVDAWQAIQDRYERERQMCRRVL